MSGLTKNTAQKGKAIAAKAQGEHSNSPAKTKTGGKGVGFEDEPQSPGFNRGDFKDSLADDPKRRTDGIDKILEGHTEGLDVDGEHVELNELAKQSNTR